MASRVIKREQTHDMQVPATKLAKVGCVCSLFWGPPTAISLAKRRCWLAYLERGPVLRGRSRTEGSYPLPRAAGPDRDLVELGGWEGGNKAGY